MGDARSATATINASDPLAVRRITLDEVSPVDEGEPVEFTVRIGDDEPVSDGTVSVAWAISANGRTHRRWWSDHKESSESADFADAEGNALDAFPAGTVTIPAGRRSVVVSVPTYDDAIHDTSGSYFARSCVIR